MLSYIPVIIFTVLIFYLALIFESTSFALLGYTSAVFVVLSFILLRYRVKRIKATIRIPIVMAEKNRMFAFKIVTKNDTGLPIRKITAKVEYGADSAKKPEKIRLRCSNVKKGTSNNYFYLSISEAGSYTFTINSIRIFDMTGLFYHTVKNGRSARIIVFPDIKSVPVSVSLGTRMYYAEESVPDDVLSGSSQDASYSVREFRAGDKLMNIHWKLSARTDELMVREHEDEKSFPVVLLAKPGLTGNERMIEWLVSISYALTDQKCFHYGAWYSKTFRDIKRIRITDEERFYAFVMTMLSDCAKEGPEDIIGEYKDKYRAEMPLHILCPEDEKNMNIDGSLITAGNIEECEIRL